MENLVIGICLYLAMGAACFAQPQGRAVPSDFSWRPQWAIFRDTLPAVLLWPLGLWHLLRV
jgi:hypothetical protein